MTAGRDRRDSRWDRPSTNGENLIRSQSKSPFESRWVPPAQSSYKHQASEKTLVHSRRTLNNAKHYRDYRKPTGVLSISNSPYMKGCQTIEELIRLASHRDLSPQHLSAFWSRIPQLLNMIRHRNHCHTSKQEHQQLKTNLKSILDDTIKQVDQFGSADITGAALGMAKIVTYFHNRSKNAILRRQHESLFKDIVFDHKFKARQDLFQLFATHSASLLPGFDVRCLANLAYAYALIERSPVLYDGTTLLDRISRYATEKSESFEPQGISNMVWAYATLGATHSHLFEKFANAVSQRNLDTFEPLHLANIVWAYSAVGKPISPLFNKVAATVVVRDLSLFSPQNLSNILLAYARTAQSSPCLFNKVAYDIITRDLKFFNPQDLCNTLWAYAKAKQSNPALFKKFADAVISSNLNPSFNNQNLANIVWAYATIGDHNHTLFEKVANAITNRDLDTFDHQNLSNTAWAFATAKIYHSRLFDVISDAAISLTCEFNAQSIAILLWAYAAIGRVDQRLFSSFVPTVAATMQDFQCQDLANIAWSYAISNVAAPDLFDCGFITALLNREHEFIDAQLRQLHQWQLWQLELGSATKLPSSLRQRCYEAFVFARVRPSVFQDDVIDVLTSIGLRPKEEVIMPSGYRMDACVIVKGENVAVEVDGPFHFTGCLPNGHTILKRRQVRCIDGAMVVSVPYWEWEALGNIRPRMQEYLSRKRGMTQATE
ncbi:hypothetical protein ACHAW5_008836 [Stephanodiscus triporus]|uniref:RNA-editing substrate-binding complex 6 protein domain-containing protein n=1 Tax=Stephanodiscus triporus TaxID=2934178 RepID=A0ABD3MJE3_9STRA